MIDTKTDNIRKYVKTYPEAILNAQKNKIKQ